MKIDGKEIAEKIYSDLRKRVGELQKKNITPSLAVILIGDDPGSVSYVHQKEKHAEMIGVDLIINKISTDISQEELASVISGYNTDPKIHGVIVQRPAPKQIAKEFLDEAVLPEKDVDGFHPDSDFAAPVALAVERILYEVFQEEAKETEETKGTTVSIDSFSQWLLGKNIVVVGKGETAGTPIINHFHNRNAYVQVVDSLTEEPEAVIKEADIVISAVGKKDIITPFLLHKNTILIGVGLHTEEGKLKGDYREDEIEEKVAFYTTTPGGVGPVNVAMLLANVVRAAEEQTGNV